MNEPRVVDAVFASESRTRHSVVALSIAFALTAHVAFFTIALFSRDSIEEWGENIATRVHDSLSRTPRIEIEAPPPPAPPAPPASEAPAAPLEAPRQAASRAAAQNTAPPAPAAAAQIVAPEVLDFTDDSIGVGNASAYAGGATAPSGTSSTAVDHAQIGGTGQGDVVEADAPPSRASLASSVALADDDWRCTWPIGAAARTDVVAVVVRVVVRADGSPESARVVRDPGDGFGAAAVACAMQRSYIAARNDDGAPIRAESPPIRVRFDP